MKICFVFPYNVVGGAFRSTYELANRLQSRGHDVEVLFPFIEPGEAAAYSSNWVTYRLKSFIRSLVRGRDVDWMQIKFKTRLVFNLRTKDLNHYDVVIFNHWQTIDWAVRNSFFGSVNNRVFAMVRDIEQWAPFHSAQLKGFKSQLNFIAVSPWVRDFITNVSLKKIPVVKNAINFDLFNFSDNPKKLTCNNPIRIGAIINDHPMKDMKRLAYIFNAINKMNDGKVDFEVVGKSKEFDAHINCPVHRRGILNSNQLSNFYNNLNFFIFTSVQEGWGNPPLEALACGCFVFSTNIGCLQSIDLSRMKQLRILGSECDFNSDALAICSAISQLENIVIDDKTNSYIKSVFDWERSCDDLLKAIGN